MPGMTPPPGRVCFPNRDGRIYSLSEDLLITPEAEEEDSGPDWLQLSRTNQIERTQDRWMRETFEYAPANHVVMLKTRELRRRDHSDLAAAANKLSHLGITVRTSDGNRGEDGVSSRRHRWIIVGNSEAAVAEQIRRIRRAVKEARWIMAKRRRAEERQARRARRARIEDGLRAQRAKLGNLNASNTPSSDNSPWDVTGNWILECEDLDQYRNDPDGRKDFTMLVVLGLDQETQRAQMYARLDFDFMTGVIRFVHRDQGDRPSQPPRPKPKVKVRPAIKPEVPQIIENSDDEESRYEPDFVIRPPHYPSQRQRKWSFRWRGERQGDGDACRNADNRVSCMTFGDGGNTCHTSIDFDLNGKVDFFGRKVRNGVGPISYSQVRRSAADEWNMRGAEYGDYMPMWALWRRW